MKINSSFYVCSKKGDAVDYQKQLKQMLKDLAKEKDTKTEKELPKMSQVCTLEAVLCFSKSVLKMKLLNLTVCLSLMKYNFSLNLDSVL